MNERRILMDLIIKNGTIVTPLESYVADLAVKGGKIVAIGTGFQKKVQVL